MKTTFDLPDPVPVPVPRGLQAVARLRGMKVNVAVEHALIDWIEKHHSAAAFSLRDASFGGGGLRPTFAATSWTELRATIYDDHDAP